MSDDTKALLEHAGVFIGRNMAGEMRWYIYSCPANDDGAHMHDGGYWATEPQFFESEAAAEAALAAAREKQAMDSIARKAANEVCGALLPFVDTEDAAQWLSKRGTDVERIIAEAIEAAQAQRETAELEAADPPLDEGTLRFIDARLAADTPRESMAGDATVEALKADAAKTTVDLSWTVEDEVGKRLLGHCKLVPTAFREERDRLAKAVEAKQFVIDEQRKDIDAETARTEAAEADAAAMRGALARLQAWTSMSSNMDRDLLIERALAANPGKPLLDELTALRKDAAKVREAMLTLPGIAADAGAMLDELVELRKRVAELDSDNDLLTEGYATIEADRDRLAAEVERLKKALDVFAGSHNWHNWLEPSAPADAKPEGAT